MRRVIIFFLFIVSLSYSQNNFHVYFNEIRADDSGTDDMEFVELIGPTGTEITGFTIIHYNGSASSDGGIWQHTIGTFTIPDDGILDELGSPLGFYVMGSALVLNNDEIIPASLQNGPDGLVLYDFENNIIDAIAWEGEGDLTQDDPGTISSVISTTANSFLQITIDDDALDNSLQAPNLGFADDGTGWLLGAATSGSINFNQLNGDISLPVEMESFTVIGHDDHIMLNWRTASEIENSGFNIYRSELEDGDFREISSYQYNIDLKGLGNSSTGKSYDFRDIDPTLKMGTIYYYKIADIDYNGNINHFGPIAASLKNIDEQSSLPMAFKLHQNFPNPFNPSTVFNYELPANSKISVMIFNALGQKIKTLYSGQQEEGHHQLKWDGRDSFDYQVGSGIYFYCLSTDNKILMKKMIKLK